MKIYTDDQLYTEFKNFLLRQGNGWFCSLVGINLVPGKNGLKFNSVYLPLFEIQEITNGWFIQLPTPERIRYIKITTTRPFIETASTPARLEDIDDPVS